MVFDLSGTGNTCSDGTATWTNYFAVPAWAGSHSYAAQAEIWDGANLEEAEGACTSGSATPTWSQNTVIGQEFTEASGTPCVWQDLGPNNVLESPAYQFYVSAPFTPTSAAQVPALSSYLLSGSMSSTWAGCSGGLPGGVTANCAVSNGGAALTSTRVVNFSAQGGGAGLPGPTLSAVSCPTTDSTACTPASGTAYYGHAAWVTPNGPIPVMGQGTVTPGSANQAIQFNANGGLPGPAPANAVGWLPYLNTAGGSFALQSVDGTNIICSAYVTNLPYGMVCALGATATVLVPQFSHPTPALETNASDIFTMIGGEWATQFQTGGSGQYASRIQNLTVECGRALNDIEYYGIGIANFDGQEQSGASYVNVNDCAQAGIYVATVGSQNSQLDHNHMAGANWDYTYGVRLENSPIRVVIDQSNNGPTQGTQWTSIAGIDKFTPARNGTGSASVVLVAMPCEACYDAVRITNEAGNLTASYGGSSNTRHSLNVLHIGNWAKDVNAWGLLGQIAGTCAVQNDTLGPTACRTSQLEVGFYNFGNYNGLASPLALECSSDQALGCTPAQAWGSITGTLSSQTDLQNALNLKAPLASPTFTGTPAAPTPTALDSSTKIATTAYVQAQGYAPLASPTFTGSPVVPGYAKASTLVSGNYPSATGGGTIGDSTVVAGPYAIGWTTELTGGNNGYLPSSSANKAMMWGVTLTYPLSTSLVTYDIGSNADNSATNNYDLGLFNSSGTLVLNLNSGTLHGSSFAPATGAVTLSWAQGNKTLQPGDYYLMYYTSNITATPPTLVSPSATAFTFYKGEAGGSGVCGTTQGSGGFAITPLAGGALPTSITPPANSYSWGACVPAIWIH